MDSLDKQLDKMLRKPEIAIGDDGFSENVLRGIPKQKINREKSRCWTLAGAAAIGSILTLLLAPPIEAVFRLFEVVSAHQLLTFAILFVITVTAVPLAMFLYSKLVDNS